MGQLLKRILKEPLVHFGLLAACLIVLTPARPTARQLVIDHAQVSALVSGYRLKTGQDPSAAQRRELIAGLVRDELMRHEAIAMGLHESDPVVRRRLVQSMEYLAETQIPTAVTQGYTERELRAELDAHSDRYSVAASLDLEHVFAKTGDSAKQRLLELQKRLGSESQEPQRSQDAEHSQAAQRGQAAQHSQEAQRSGDPFIKGSEFRAKTQVQLTSLFGAEFAEQVFELASKAGAKQVWLGPIPSSYGWHLVRIQAYTPRRTQSLELARPALTAALSEARRAGQREAFVRKLSERYEIRVDDAAWKLTP